MKDDQILAADESTGVPRRFQPSRSHRILVVDDDVFIRRVNAEALTRSGYEVDLAEDGVAAWDTLQLNSYDLMITDNNMPRLSGAGLVKKLRDGAVTLPVIMATGTLPTQEADRNPQVQPTAVLLKPYTIEKLLETVKAVLLEAKQHRPAARDRAQGIQKNSGIRRRSGSSQ